MALCAEHSSGGDIAPNDIHVSLVASNEGKKLDRENECVGSCFPKNATPYGS